MTLQKESDLSLNEIVVQNHQKDDSHIQEVHLVQTQSDLKKQQKDIEEALNLFVERIANCFHSFTGRTIDTISKKEDLFFGMFLTKNQKKNVYLIMSTHPYIPIIQDSTNFGPDTDLSSYILEELHTFDNDEQLLIIEKCIMDAVVDCVYDLISGSCTDLINQEEIKNI